MQIAICIMFIVKAMDITAYDDHFQKVLQVSLFTIVHCSGICWGISFLA